VCLCTADGAPNCFNKCHPNVMFAYVGTRHSANRRKACHWFEAFSTSALYVREEIYSRSCLF
jgi:hypothetical protein